MIEIMFIGVFKILEHFVSNVETLCFIDGNKMFQVRKQRRNMLIINGLI